MRVLLSGGGTAGHINPALAIAECIKENIPDCEILFAGTPFGMEARLIPEAGYAFTPIKVRGFQRSFAPGDIVKNIEAAGLLLSAMPRAKKIIKDFKPDLVIGTGGYVCGPILKTAAKMGIKTAIHESNAFPGVTTKLVAKQMDVVMLATPDARRHLDADANCVVTGNPISSDFFGQDKEKARRALGVEDDFCVLSFGGSLGAGKINETVCDLIEWEQKTGGIHHIHSYGRMGKATFVKTLEGKGIYPESDPHLDIREYINNMPVCMAAADLVICRAGAMTLTQIQAMGLPSILIPSPVVAENHQYHNAMVLQNNGAGIVIEQSELTSERLISEVSAIYHDRDRLSELSANAKKLAVTDAKEKIFAELMKLLH
ncbi:MAG: undecaprenyldiphospho-muramoylpentapeptide beta-N-acetylglucosaminyltransferase [Oscillospiraceae bacterium]